MTRSEYYRFENGAFTNEDLKELFIGSTRDPALGSDIQRFCKETDRSVAEARRKDRLSLFSVYADFDCEEGSHLEIEDNAKFYRSEDLKAPFVESNVKLKEVLVTLEKLDFPLKVAQDGTKQYNVSWAKYYLD